MGLDLPEHELDWVVVDVESSGTHFDDPAYISCVGVAYPDTGGGAIDIRAFPFDQGVRDKLPHVQMGLFGSESQDPNLGEEEWVDLLAWLQRQNIVNHNLKYDLHMLRAGTRHWPGVCLGDRAAWCTMVAQRILDPLEDVGLDKVTQRLGIGQKQNIEELKNWLKRNKYPLHRYDLVPWDIIEPYVRGDVQITAELYLHQQRRLGMEVRRGDAERLQQREMPLLRALYRMEQRGVGYDADASIVAARELERRAAGVEERMPFAADINSAKRYFFEQKKLVPGRYTDGGKPCLDEEQVREWADQGVDWAPEYYEVSRARRAVSMWYQGYPDKLGPDGRLRTDFKQARVKSGRMSVGRVQLQAMPKGDKYSRVGSSEILDIYKGVPAVRDLLRAKPGHGLWSMDLGQAELRIGSKYAGCKKMIELLLSGRDAHGHTTETVLGTPRDDPHFKYRRDIGKRLNFAAIFMVGGETFQRQLEKLADIHLPIEECEQMVRAWRREYPEFQVVYEQAKRSVEQHGYVRILPGTPYEMPSYFGPNDYVRTAWNRRVQQSLAEVFKMLMLGVEQRWPGYMILTIHDSILLEAPLDEGDQLIHDVATWCAQFATDVFDFPMTADTERYDKALQLEEAA